MYTDKKIQIEETNDNSTITTWNEYSRYHDYFVELLSYNRKHNFSTSNVWEFAYV